MVEADVDQLFRRYDRVLAGSALPFLDRLRPGHPDPLSDVSRTGMQMGIAGAAGWTLPLDLRAWWGWHDGIEDPYRAPLGSIGGNLNFLPVAEACKQWKSRYQDALWYSPSQPEDFWPPTWLPIAESEVTIVALDLASVQGDWGDYWFKDREESPQMAQLIARRWRDAIEGWVRVLEAGAMVHTEHGWTFSGRLCPPDLIGNYLAMPDPWSDPPARGSAQ